MHSQQLSDFSLINEFLHQLLLQSLLQVERPEIALLDSHPGEHDLNNHQEILMNIEEKILQKAINTGLLLWSHEVLSQEMVELDNSYCYGLILLTFEHDCLQVSVFYHLDSDYLSEVSWARLVLGLTGLSYVPPVVTI